MALSKALHLIGLRYFKVIIVLSVELNLVTQILCSVLMVGLNAIQWGVGKRGD